MSGSKFKERLARLGPIRAVDRVPSGSRVVVELRVADVSKVKVVTATEILARRGLSMLKAKRAVEAALAAGSHRLIVPTVENIESLTADLATADIEAVTVADWEPDVAAIRGALGLTQEQFCLHFGLTLDTLQNWETGRRTKLDSVACAYLRTIACAPDVVAAAQARRAGTVVEVPSSLALPVRKGEPAKVTLKA